MIEFVEEEEFFDDPAPRQPVRDNERPSNSGTGPNSPRWDGPVIYSSYSGIWPEPGSDLPTAEPPEQSAANLIIIAPEPQAVDNGPQPELEDTDSPMGHAEEMCLRCHGVIMSDPPDPSNKNPQCDSIKTESDVNTEDPTSPQMPHLEPEIPLLSRNKAKSPSTVDNQHDTNDLYSANIVIQNKLLTTSTSSTIAGVGLSVAGGASYPPCQCSCHDCSGDHQHDAVKPDPDAPSQVVQVKSEPQLPEKQESWDLLKSDALPEYLLPSGVGHPLDSRLPGKSRNVAFKRTGKARKITARAKPRTVLQPTLDSTEIVNIKLEADTERLEVTQVKKEPLEEGMDPEYGEISETLLPKKAIVLLTKLPVDYENTVNTLKIEERNRSHGRRDNKSRVTKGRSHKRKMSENQDNKSGMYDTCGQRPKRRCTATVSYANQDAIASDDSDEEYKNKRAEILTSDDSTPSMSDDDEGIGNDSDSSNQHQSGSDQSENDMIRNRGERSDVIKSSGVNASMLAGIPSFANEQSLFAWLKQNDLQCPCCSGTFSTLPSLRVHLEGHKSDMLKCVKGHKFICNICYDVFDTINGMGIHKSRKHKVVKPKKKDRKEHVSEQHVLFAKWNRVLCFVSESKSDVTRTCCACGERFKDKTTLDMHKLLKHPTLNDKSALFAYKCDSCQKGFPSSKLVMEHRRCVHKEVIKVEEDKLKVRSGKLKCSLCSTEFQYNSSLEEHMNIIHKGSRYRCDVCGEVVIEAKTMTAHRRKEHPSSPYVDPNKLLNLYGIKLEKREKEVKCEVCGQQFDDRLFLATHMKEHEDLCYVCDVCGISCSSPEWVLKHRNGRHPDAPRVDISVLTKKVVLAVDTKRGRKLRDPLKCTICSKEFMYRSEMGEHLMQIHDGMCYLCDICGETTTRAEAMVQHRDKAHPGAPKIEPKKLLVKRKEKIKEDKPKGMLKCSVCSKKLKSKDLLREHMTTHKNLCYVCDVCGMGYSGPDWCMKHRLKRHPDAPQLEPEQLAKEVTKKPK